MSYSYKKCSQTQVEKMLIARKCMSLHLDEQSPIVSECEVVGCLGVISPVPGISPTFCTYPEGQSKK